MHAAAFHLVAPANKKRYSQFPSIVGTPALFRNVFPHISYLSFLFRIAFIAHLSPSRILCLGFLMYRKFVGITHGSFGIVFVNISALLFGLFFFE